MNKNKYLKIGIVALTTAVGSALPAFADVIDFDSITGPSLFASASPIPQTVVLDGTTFSGGVVLTTTANLPVDQTSVYGSANFVSGMSNPITISNPTGFDNFFFDLLNGQISPQDFLIQDNAGHSAEFDNIPSNLHSGAAVVGFASTGTQVTITDLTDGNNLNGSWDFFIDNVNFDVPLPPSLNAPDVSSTASMMAGSFLALVGFARRRCVKA